MKNWKQHLEKFKKLRRLYGDSPTAIKKADPQTAQWVDDVRKSAGHLPPPLIDALRKLHFDFHVSDDTSWNTQYNQLAKFWEKQGHTYVPNDKPYLKLYEWTQKMRLAKSVLPKAQVALLDELGFDWTPHNSKVARWEFMYQKLVAFKKAHGHITVPYNDPQYKDLFLWAANIRARAGALNDRQKARLTALGFLWRGDRKKAAEQQWMTRYKQLKDFKQQFGHCNVPIHWKPNRKLAVWVSEQRLREKNKGLLAERKKLLEKIGFSWSEDLVQQFDRDWNLMFTQVKAYYKALEQRQGKRMPKRAHKLHVWITAQRTMKKLNMLPAARVRKLESIGFTWGDVRRLHWEKMFAAFKQYKKDHGTVQFVNKKEYKSLGDWIVQQRQLRAKGVLAHDRVRRLEALGFLWANTLLSTLWMRKYEELIQLKKKHGHLNFSPAKHRQMVTWIRKQRARKKLGRISDEQLQLLNKIGFTWEDNRQSRWDKSYQRLAQYKKVHGTVQVKETLDSGLFRWLSKQRQKNKTGSLPAERVQRLKKLGVKLALRWTRKS